jgi:hypothetical protein
MAEFYPTNLYAIGANSIVELLLATITHTLVVVTNISCVVSAHTAILVGTTHGIHCHY